VAASPLRAALTREVLWSPGGEVTCEKPRGLADLDQVSVGVAHVQRISVPRSIGDVSKCAARALQATRRFKKTEVVSSNS